jgi:hypothetical protein
MEWVLDAWRYTSTSQYAFMAWCSVKAQGQLHFSGNLVQGQIYVLPLVLIDVCNITILM